MNMPTTGALVQVVEYNLEWPDHFLQLRDRIWPFVRDIAVAIEHVGSTAVGGLAAKPIIDLDIVIPSRSDLALTWRGSDAWDTNIAAISESKIERRSGHRRINRLTTSTCAQRAVLRLEITLHFGIIFAAVRTMPRRIPA